MTSWKRTPSGRIPVAVLAATGTVGQRFVERLHDHPTFEVTRVVASTRSAGTPYGEATAWKLPGFVPSSVQALVVETLEDFLKRPNVAIAFSALPSEEASVWESKVAATGTFVFTNASPNRMAEGVPLLIPEINGAAIEGARRSRIVANGNCSAIVLELALWPLLPFGIERVDVTTLQGLSGAGYPGVSSLDVVDNVVPYIGGEEDKLETEPAKTLGLAAPIRATCTRVPVLEGHLESIHVELKDSVSKEQLLAAFQNVDVPASIRGLPSSPDQLYQVFDTPDRPQPRLDRDAGAGMTVSVGRFRVSEGGHRVQFLALGSNTIRGAAGQSILNAEYAHAIGLLEG